MSESCGYIPPYVREVPLQLFAQDKNRVSIDGPNGTVWYHPLVDVGTITARITYTRTRDYSSTTFPPNTYETNAPLRYHPYFKIEPVGALPAIDPDVYLVSDSTYWGVYGLNYGGIEGGYDVIRRRGSERIIIDEAIMGQSDPSPENYLEIDGIYTDPPYSTNFRAWIANRNRPNEELHDIVIGLINQINSVVYTLAVT